MTFPTSFVGRQHELATIAQRLADPACRLLTLLGPGGIGKTRLAWEVARLQQEIFDDGVFFAVLQPLSSPEFIVPTIMDAMQLQLSPTDEPKHQLLYHLRDKLLLLILDNFEHLLDGAELISEILAYAPRVKILVTSRERLNLVEEWVLNIEGLSVPYHDSENKIDEYEAVQLFVRSAERVNAGFLLTEAQKAAVTRICQLVGGMPLGIEMAAAWVRALTCEEIAAEIERSMDILATPARNVPPRHRNMRAALEHSWKLLPTIEQYVFKRLSVFRGGFTRDAAEAVAGASVWTLTALVDKSLLRVDASGRYHLQELLRQYAEEQLEISGELQDMQTRHAGYYATFLEQRWDGLRSQQQRQMLDNIDADLENVRKAWQTMCQQRDAAGLARSAKSLWLAYDLRCRFQEMITLFGQAADALRSSVPESNSVIGLLKALGGWAHVGYGKPEKGHRLVQEGVALLQHTDAIEDLLVALLALQLTTHFLNQPVAFMRVSRRVIALATQHENYWVLARALYDQSNFIIGYTERPGGYIEHTPSPSRKRPAIAKDIQRIGEECLRLAEICGDTWLRACVSGFLLGNINRVLGHYTDAKRRYEQGRRLFEEVDQSWSMGAVDRILGITAHEMKDYAAAHQYYLSSLRVYTANGQVHEQLATLAFMVELLIEEGYKEKAVELMTVVIDHPASFNATRAEAEILRQQLETEMPADRYLAAVERGRNAQWDAVLAQLLAEEEIAPESIISPDQPAMDRLTEREIEILKLMAQGLTNREIAQTLFLSVGTVKWYSSQILSKFQVQNRVQALAQARALHLL